MNVGDVIDEKYRIVRVMGEGGMGSVFEAQHQLVGQRYALKCLHPNLAADQTMVKRFIREARAAAAIGSEHIVYVTDGGLTDNGSPYIVMEYLEGEDLESLIEREGQLEPERAVGLMLQVCEALEAAHSKGIIHRDLKPANLFLVTREQVGEWVKVLDFGIAKFYEGEKANAPTLTRTGTSMGTPYYMSPEQFRGTRDVDRRADVYSAGVILYQMLAGRPPFEASTYEDLIIQVATAEPAPLRSFNFRVDEELEQVTHKAMARHADRRYGSARELSDALRSYLQQSDFGGAASDGEHNNDMALAMTDPQQRRGTSSPVQPTHVVPTRPPPTQAQYGESSYGEHPQLMAAEAELRPAPPPRSRRTLYVFGAIIALVLAAIGAALMALVLISNVSTEDRAPQADVTHPQVEAQPQVALQPAPPGLSSHQGIPTAQDSPPTQPSVLEPSAGHQPNATIAPTIVPQPEASAGVSLRPASEMSEGVDGDAGSTPQPAQAKIRGRVSRVSSHMRIRGDLERSEVLRVLNTGMGAITRCYESRLMTDPGLNGRLVLAWTITTSGEVSDVSVRSSSLSDPEVAQCISSVIGGLRFPRPGGGDASVTFPFRFHVVDDGD